MELNKSIESAKPLWVSSVISKIKAMGKSQYVKLAERTPLYFIDQVFGDFKTSKIYSALFEKPAIAYSRYRTETKKISERLSKAQNKLDAYFKGNANSTTMSRYKMTAYLIQKEYE
jgi:hypothetical protein